MAQKKVVSDSTPSKRLIRFGSFEADLSSRELLRNGVKLRFQDQPFQVLTVLLENHSKVVSREELRQKLWSEDTFVDFDKGLNTTINKIREALGDSAETPQFVETLPRRGYRFMETVEFKGRNAVQSIAVLPLENLSRDPEQEYVAALYFTWAIWDTCTVQRDAKSKLCSW